MLQLPPDLTRGCYEVARVLLTQYVQSFFESALLDLAVSGEVSAGGTVVGEVVFGQETLSPCIVARRKVYLSQEEGVIGVPYLAH